MTPKGLTPKQRRFVDEYLVDLDPVAAAVRAGDAEDPAATGKMLLADLAVVAAIDAELAQRSVQITDAQMRTIALLVEVAGDDLQKLFDEHGRLKSFRKLDPETAAFVISNDNGGSQRVRKVGSAAATPSQCCSDLRLRALELSTQQFERPDGLEEQPSVQFIVER